MDVRYIIKNDDKKSITVTESKKGRKINWNLPPIPSAILKYFNNGHTIIIMHHM